MVHTSIHATFNQYHGLNPHLHSFWQEERRWNRFHAPHMAHVLELMQAHLLPMGYTAEFDESVQIRRMGDRLPRYPRPDLLIRQLPRRPTTPSAPVALSTPSIPLEELVEGQPDFDHPYAAIMISELTAEGEIGKPIAWLELLSPTNKGYDRDAMAYLAKRDLMLEQQLVFVELDYLHETPPTFYRLADYTRQETDSHPYRILVIDPRPEIRDAVVYLHEFDVDTPLPTVEIPLNEGDTLLFDFDAAYQLSFQRLWYGTKVDYYNLPLAMERYTAADQCRILNRLIVILEATQRGDELKNTPLALPDSQLELEAARARYAALRGT